jgi:hypothetical protein
MNLSDIHSSVRPFAVSLLLLVSAAAAAAAVLGKDLPDQHDQAVTATVGLALAVVSALLLALPRVGMRLQVLLWLLGLGGSAVAFGGMQAPSVARAFLGIAIVDALALAVIVVMLQADEALSEPSSRL